MKFEKTSCLLFTIIVQSVKSSCLKSWEVENVECNYKAIKDEFEERGLLDNCNRDDWSVLNELEVAFGVKGEAAVRESIAASCSENYVPFSEITDEGPVFDKEYYDGGTFYNEAREYVNSYGIPLDELEVNPGRRITAIQDNIAQSNGITFPLASAIDNFENCDLRAVTCCFVQDRQAGDNNGNCDDPYDENCNDANPADNVDVCYVDMARSPTSSRTTEGFAVFEDEAEDDSHCHGFAWAAHADDQSGRFKGNNLFYVSMYDHLTQRGYARNVPGAPMCGCVEKMPVVTRADCTQIDIDEEVTFSYENGKGVDVKVINLEIDFNACQGVDDNGEAQNNDLNAYYNQLFIDDKVTKEEREVFKKTIVGETYCREAIDDFLSVQGLEKIPACEHSDPEQCGCEEVKRSDYKGTINFTEEHKGMGSLECQRWDSQYPHKHSRTRENYPNAYLEENYCRNPDGESGGAWCYTTDPNVRWKYCDVPTCGQTDTPTVAPTPKCVDWNPDECGCPETNQADYRGTISVTESGRTCMPWTDQAPHKHSYQPVYYPYAGLDENYCRNPSSGGRAWCYTNDPKKRWEYCDVPTCGYTSTPTAAPTPKCDNYNPDECGCSTNNQADYRGTTSVTESGRTCMSWNSNKPHKHSRKPKKYPNSGLDENYCRNPDGEDRAWCYTTDLKKRWEYCDVPTCDEKTKRLRGRI